MLLQSICQSCTISSSITWRSERCWQNLTITTTLIGVRCRQLRKHHTVLKSNYRIAYRKATKNFIARKFYEKNYSYLKAMMMSIRKQAMMGDKCLIPSKRKHMAPVDRDKNKLIENSIKFSRFK